VASTVLKTSGRGDPLAEFNRAIRPGVQWRKGSFGTQSKDGSRFVESMMTVVATLKQQQRNVLDYLTAAHEAALCGELAPSLLPEGDQKSQAAA
jgi:transposase